MRDDLFSVPIRKYHLDNNKEQFVSFVESYYNNGKFEEPSPYLKTIEQLPPWTCPVYSDLIESFLNDLFSKPQLRNELDKVSAWMLSRLYE